MLPKLDSSYSHYRLIEEIGQGGIGKVYRAIDTRNEQVVAIKFLHAALANDPKHLGIFHRELLIMAGLRHKHLVAYLDSCFKPPTCFIVTEFVQGWSLREFMRKIGTIPPLVSLSIIFEILRGLDYLHLHDVIHSDLSAANILLDVTGRVRVTDFGLASRFEIEDYADYILGTPGYYSPEHVTRIPMVPRSDLYCVGLILFELVTGQKAVIASKERAAVLKSMKSISVKGVKTTNKFLNNSLHKILSEALQFHVSRRTENTEAMLYQIFKVLEKFDIRFSRLAILQFLIDQKFVFLKGEVQKQDIYLGTEAA